MIPVPFGGFPSGLAWVASQDQGLAVLQSALAWGSTLDQTVVEETIDFTFSAVDGGVLTAGADDPFGGTTAYHFADTNGVTATPRWLANAMTPAMQAGGALYTVEMWSRVHPDVASTPIRWSSYVTATKTAVWAGSIFALVPYNAAISGAPGDSEFEGRLSNAAFMGEVQRGELYKKGPENGPWIRLRARMTAFDKIERWNGSPYTQTGVNTGVLTRPTITRRSVSAQTNLATGSAATITQGTAGARPELDPDTWIDGNDVIHTDDHDGYLTVSEVPAALSGTGIPWTYSAALDFRRVWNIRTNHGGSTGGPIFRVIGGTASLAINQTATGLEVVRTNDAGTTTTATLPISWIEYFAHVITLTCDGSSVQLHVNGLPVGAPQSIGSGAATFTEARAIGASNVAVGEWTIADREWSAAEVAAAASSLGARRGISVGPVQLWWGTSQSNGQFPGGLSSYPDTNPDAFWRLSDADQDLYGAGRHARLFAYDHNIAGAANLFDWGPNRGEKPSPYSTTTTDWAINRYGFGPHLGFLTQRGAHVALMHYAAGGAPISTILPGGSEWTNAVAFWDAKIAALEAAGIQWTPAGVINIHGEADASGTIGLAQDFPNQLEALRTSLESEYGVTISQVVHPRLSSAFTGGAWRDEERAAVEAWEVAQPSARVLVDIDGLALKSDGVHHTNATTLEAGKRMGAPSNRVKDLP